MDARVGLIGFFNVGAYSDDLIADTTQRVLRRVDPTLQFDTDVMRRCGHGTDPDYLNRFDVLVHCGGSLLGKCTHYPLRDIDAWIDRVDTPIAVFGAGYRYEPTLEPLNATMRRRLRLLFARAAVVSLRGHRTLHYLAQNGVDVPHLHSLGDPVMACDLPLDRDPRCIVGNVRNPPPNEVQHAPTASVQRLMASIYDWLIDRYDQPLTLLAFRHNVAVDSDVAGAEATRAQMRHRDRVTIAARGDVRGALTAMRHASLFVGQRLHPTIFAAIRGVPFVGVEYQFNKLLDWISTVGIDNYVHTGTATLDSFVKAHRRVERCMATLRHVLPVRVREIHQVAERIVELI